MRISRNIRAFSLAGVASAALVSAASAQAPAATSADGSPAGSVEEIVVTGSSIRGAPPVGSNLTTVTAADIQVTPAQTLQQILTSVPQINGFGMSGQGAYQSNDGAGSNIPSIHGLGGSSSTSTLVLIDGHRFPLTGVVHTLGDPNMIPPNAIQRVEVLADGASSVYGSDAVAGVINFITRSRYDGIEASGQMGFADGYKNWSANLLAGKTWDNASVWVAYAHSDRSNLSAGDRPFTQADHRAQGGSNLATFNCQPASVQPAGGSLVYLYPYSGAGITNVQANSPCDFGNPNSDLLPEEIRDAVMAKATIELTDRLTISADMVFSDRHNTSRNARGSTTTTIFGPGSGRGTQINPFYQNVPGNSTATSQTIRLNYDELLGPGAKTDAGARDFYFHGNVEYKLNDNWRLVAQGVAGVDESFTTSTGQVCGSCANLALNGTTNGGGSLTAVSVPSTGLIVVQPLTTANSLDPYNPAGSNRTSAAVLAQLRDTKTERRAWQSIADVSLQLNGSLFSLPAGDVKIALGGEFARYGVRAASVTSLNIGPSSTGSAFATFPFPDRTVWSGFAEVLWPVVSPEMAIPLVRSFDINTSARYDHYNDVGGTTNPRIGANWELFQGLKLRGNWAQSFVAPQILFNGIDGRGLNVESSFGLSTGVTGLPIANFPDAARFPGCANVTVCTVGTSITGLQLNGGQPVKPQTGETYSFGADFAPDVIPGLRIGLTYWNNKMLGGLTAPTQSLAVGTPSLFSRFTLYPNGATPAQIAAAAGSLPQTSAIPATVYYIYDFRIGNVLNLYVSGIDMDANYSVNTSFGRITVGNALTYLTKFDQQTGNGARFSVLNTDGFNSTFPSIRLNGRARLGVDIGNLSVDSFLNYSGSYRNYSGNTVTPITRDAAASPIGGGDKVRSHVTFDLHVAYTIPGLFDRTEVFFDAKNLFDRDPPFFNSPNGYDPLAGNPIGRLITVGFRATY